MNAFRLVVALVLLGSLAAPAALGADGATEINQQGAVAGGVTFGDTPGFPVTLSRSGSYVLTSTLRVLDADTTAILLQTNNVTIDLNGFHITGPTVCTTNPTTCAPTGGGDGIDAGFLRGLSVHNGYITGVGAFGIRALGVNHRIERITTHQTGFQGIRVGSNSIVKDCTGFANGDDGIYAGAGSVITGNTIARSGDNGIFAGSGVLVEGNSVQYSGSDGIATAPTSVAAPALVRNNLVINNLGFGLNLEPETGYSGNTIYGNSAGTVSGGTQMGTNLCNGSTGCP